MTHNITIPLSASLKLELDKPSNELLALLQRLQMSEAPTETQAAPDPPSPPSHGEYWAGQGGYYICTLPAMLRLPARHLVAGKDETKATFGPYEDVNGASSPIDSRSNTKALLEHGNHPAAKWAVNYMADGHADFDLPSKLDLVMAQICVPQLFDKEGYYWTSTQFSRFGAFVQDFEYGNSHWYSKDNEHRVRAFRWIQL